MALFACGRAFKPALLQEPLAEHWFLKEHLMMLSKESVAGLLSVVIGKSLPLFASHPHFVGSISLALRVLHTLT